MAVAAGELNNDDDQHEHADRLDPELALAHVNLGVVLHATKRYAEAGAACREAIRLDPELATAHVNLGVVLSGMKRDAEAEAEYREAIRSDADLAQAHKNLGVLLHKTKRYAEAEAALAEAARLDPACVNLETYLRVRRSSWFKSLRTPRRART